MLFLPQGLILPTKTQDCFWISIWVAHNPGTHADLGVLAHTSNPNTSEERQEDCNGLEASLGLQFQASLGSRVRAYLKQ